jgi:hypothetical protein
MRQRTPAVLNLYDLRAQNPVGPFFGAVMTRHLNTWAKIGALALIFFAAVLVGIEVSLHVDAAIHGSKYSINYTMLLIALIVGFVGMYILSPPRAKEGGQFIVDSTVKIIQVFRAGRRKNDPVAAVIEDKQGHSGTIVIPVPPHESEIPLESSQEVADSPQRRCTDPNHTGTHPIPPRGIDT